MRLVNRFYWIIERKSYLEKMNNLPKHWRGAPEAQGPMQLHRLKAGPDHIHMEWICLQRLELDECLTEW